MKADSDRGAPGRLRRAALFLRSGRFIVTVVLAIAAGAVATALLPQDPDAEAVAAFAHEWPRLGRVTGALGLHALTTSAWFLALVGVAFVSLVLVQLDQWKRVRRTWRAEPSASAFARAPYRRELPLPAVPPASYVRSAGRAGTLGSPTFHLGLLLAVTSALFRLLFFGEGVVRVMEGETLPRDPSAFDVARKGPLARPFAMPVELRVEEVLPEHYDSGVLRQVSARVVAGGEAHTLAINDPLDVGATRIYVTQAHGVAALLQIERGAEVERVRTFLGGPEPRARVPLGPGRELRLRGIPPAAPTALEARAVDEGRLVAAAALGPGSALDAGGARVRLDGLPRWVELRGSYDPTRPFFFAGLALAITGIALLFGVVRVDSAVFVERDRLVVAMRPHRFAPLFAERFEQLCARFRTGETRT